MINMGNKGYYERMRKNGNTSISAWFSTKDLELIDKHIRRVKVLSYNKTGVRIRLSRADVVRSATMRLIEEMKDATD